MTGRAALGTTVILSLAVALPAAARAACEPFAEGYTILAVLDDHATFGRDAMTTCASNFSQTLLGLPAAQVQWCDRPDIVKHLKNKKELGWALDNGIIMIIVQRGENLEHTIVPYELAQNGAPLIFDTCPATKDSTGQVSKTYQSRLGAWLASAVALASARSQPRAQCQRASKIQESFNLAMEGLRKASTPAEKALLQHLEEKSRALSKEMREQCPPSNLNSEVLKSKPISAVGGDPTGPSG